MKITLQSFKRREKLHYFFEKAQTFGANDVDVHSILETHDRGVNWCDFHPELDMIVSGADDRKIKLWKYNETRAWDHDSLYGHKNNVSSVVFHPKLSNFRNNYTHKIFHLH